MVAEAERGVMFTLKVQEDDQAASIMKRWGAKLGKLDTERIESATRRQQQAAQTQTNMLGEYLSRQNQAVQGSVATQDRAVVDSVALQDKVREKQTRDFAAEQKKRDQIIESSRAKLDASTSQMSAGLSSLAAGITSVGQGWAYLGISSKETSEEMIKALLKVQGVVQLARGGIDIYRGITESVKAYRAAILAATAAQQALNAAQAMSAVTGGVAGAGGTRGLGGAAGSAMGGAAGGYAAGKLPMAAKGIQALTTAVGGAMAALGTFEAAILGAAAALGMAGNAFGMRDKAANWMGQSSLLGPLLGPDAILGSRLSSEKTQWGQRMWAGLLGGQATDPQAEYQKSKAKLTRAELTQSAEQDFAAKAPDLIHKLIRAQLEAQPRTGAEIGAHIGSLEARQERARTEPAGTNSMAEALSVESQIRAFKIEAATVLEKEIAAAEKRRDVTRQESKERIQTADQLIDKAKARLDVNKRIIDQQKGVLQSAKERFAMMDPLKQRNLIQLKQRADRGEQLSAQQYAELGSVGTARAKKLGGEGLRDIAERRGFSRHFGEQERETIADTRRERERLAVEIQDKRQFQVDVKTRDDELVSRISETIQQKMRQRDKYIQAGVQRQLELAEEHWQRAQNERLAAGAAPVR